MKIVVSILVSFSTLLALGQSKKEQIESLQKTLQETRKAYESHIKRLGDDILELSKQRDSLDKKQNSCVIKLNEIQKENTSYAAKLNKVQKENTSYFDQLNKVQKENTSYAAKLNKVQKENASYVYQLNKIQQELKSKNDSINQLQLELKALTSNNLAYQTSESTSALSKADFLNNYVVNHQPLNNNTFSFQLAKIITYDGRFNREGIPSILDKDNFYITYIPEGKNIKVETAKTLVSKKPISLLNSRMPQIEVLKNKLVTIKYKNGDEESLLYNYESTKNTANEQRRITLASETVRNQSKDIVWAICEINGESYIHLSHSQLKRLKIPLDGNIDQVDYTYRETYRETYDNGGFDSASSYIDLGRLPYSSDFRAECRTKEKLWLTLKKNTWVDVDKKIDARDCTYLFKLVENE